MNHRLNYGAVGNCRTAALISESRKHRMALPARVRLSVDLRGPAGPSRREGASASRYREANTAPSSPTFRTRIFSPRTFIVGRGRVHRYWISCPITGRQNSEHYHSGRALPLRTVVSGAVPRFRVHYAPAPRLCPGKAPIRNVGTEYIESHSLADRDGPAIPLRLAAARRRSQRSREIVLETRRILSAVATTRR